jgi:hypothetical protein
LVSDDQFEIDSATQWLLVSLTQKLLAGSLDDQIPKIDRTITDALVKMWDDWNQHDIDRLDIEQLCLNSNSSWDRYTRNLTPDLPTMLSDYVLAIAEEHDKFQLLWIALRNTLTLQQQDILLSWYRAAAQSLTGREIILPS